MGSNPNFWYIIRLQYKYILRLTHIKKKLCIFTFWYFFLYCPIDSVFIEFEGSLTCTLCLEREFARYPQAVKRHFGGGRTWNIFKILANRKLDTVKWRNTSAISSQVSMEEEAATPNSLTSIREKLKRKKTNTFYIWIIVFYHRINSIAGPKHWRRFCKVGSIPRLAHSASAHA